MNGKKGIILTGAIVGILAVVLVKLGNAGNYGLCIACFIRDTVGALGLHRAAVVQYIRPEIIGIVLGAFIMAVAGKEYNARGGSSPFVRFVLGFIVIIGALMFLGCPLRMVLRLAGGDLNAVFGILGFVAGIGSGIVFLNKGFTLKRTYTLSSFEGYMFPTLCAGLFMLLIARPAFVLFSESGPGASHAPVMISLAAGLVVGILAQRTRLCMVGGLRDVFMFNDWHLLSGFIAILVAALAANAAAGNFNPGFTGQPIAHSDGLWNFLGMGLAGLCSVLLGGCPLRQLILSAEGNIDSVITVMGMAAGAAFAHNFGLAASANGPTANGKTAVVIGFLVAAAIGCSNMDKATDIKMKGDVSVDA